ncbi:MAG TPA: hypothetical protein PLF92_04455 [Arenimonas sp.]|nr:hypothetical protein [Arenimonas sp.]HPW32138.1 hypothetical protein [Arenimonas sp.]
MSRKAIATTSLVLLAIAGLQTADVATASDVTAVKEISSISASRNYRQMSINVDAKLYQVTFEKPCTALKHSDVSANTQMTQQLTVGSELKVGTSSCMIKSIQRDLDLSSLATARDDNDPRQMLSDPTKSLRHSR